MRESRIVIPRADPSPPPESLQELIHLAGIPGPSGWEGAVADHVERACRRITGAETRRIGDLLLVSRGRPRTAVVAHLDTTGFTLGPDGAAIPIGQPDAAGGEALRPVPGMSGRAEGGPVTCGEAGGGGRRGERASGRRGEGASGREGDGAEDRDGKGATARLEKRSGGFRIGSDGEPGSAWVYADPVREEGGLLAGPYLDNRAGVWSALRALDRAPDVLVAFTTGEEHSGRGALIAARWMVERYGIRQALICDITWDTAHVHCGLGPAISLRDRFVPRHGYLERVLAVAERSGLPFQREVESDGSSDGGWMERSGFPIDWVFVGPPEKRPHTNREELAVADLLATPELVTALVARL